MKNRNKHQVIEYYKKMRKEHPINKELNAKRLQERKESRKNVTFKKIHVEL